MKSVYESYKQKCKELGLKPSPRKKLLGEDINREKSKKHIDISTKSQERKVPKPRLAEMAKEALLVVKRVKKKKVILKPKVNLKLKTDMQRAREAFVPELFVKVGYIDGFKYLHKKTGKKFTKADVEKYIKGGPDGKTKGND